MDNQALWPSHFRCVVILPDYKIPRMTALHNPRLYHLELYVNGSQMIPEWAQQVAKLRKKLGLRQVDFAARFGVTQAAVSGWETGRKEPSVENYLVMGNMAEDPDCLWFWQRAGVDTSRISCKQH